MSTQTQTLGQTGFAAPRPTVRRALGWLLALDALFRERHALAELDDRMLRDIGVSRGDVAHTLRRPEAQLRSILLRDVNQRQY